MTRLSGPGAGRFGITVNAIAAGLTAGTASSAATTEDVRERIIAMTPLGRLPVPMTSPEGSRVGVRHGRLHYRTMSARRWWADHALRRRGGVLTRYGCRIRLVQWNAARVKAPIGVRACGRR